MSTLYPVNVVVSSNSAFARSYNEHDASSFFVSQCLAPEQAAALLDDGALLNSVILLDGEGEEIVGRLQRIVSDEELMPKVRRVASGRDSADTVQKVHETIIEDDFTDYGMG